MSYHSKAYTYGRRIREGLESRALSRIVLAHQNYTDNFKLINSSPGKQTHNQIQIHFTKQTLIHFLLSFPNTVFPENKPYKFGSVTILLYVLKCLWAAAFYYVYLILAQFYSGRKMGIVLLLLIVYVSSDIVLDTRVLILNTYEYVGMVLWRSGGILISNP